ncbi:hypothetical protein PMZ80_009718 [Knufia obscura]|uniref:Uncharacterized protein n=1 Tax=Knufia obscura TaxID=1635080 RepID=A0ABR0RBX3_9EURO|nr:hypothetical protein PMZ80_009718 [Knufia obscura]
MSHTQLKPSIPAAGVQTKADEHGLDTMGCHTCLRMARRKSSHKQIGPVETCLLCNTEYCNTHSSPSVPGTCEMNHETYCRKQEHKDLHHPTEIFRNMAERNDFIARNGDRNVVLHEQDMDDS